MRRTEFKVALVCLYVIHNTFSDSLVRRTIFGKEAKDLDLQESAILVAMLKNPRQYNPNREISKAKSLQRRNVVFAQMAKNGFISEMKKKELQSLPLKINFTPESHSDGYATYFRTHLQKVLKDWVDKNPKPNGDKYNIFKDLNHIS